ncbi:MAG: hypothetical protein V4694_04155 [Pseudomonadota bacterium]
MSESKIKKYLGSVSFPIFSCSLVFLLSIFLRSRLDIGGDSSFYIDIATKMANGGKYYYDFFESNFPLSFWIHIIPLSVAGFFKISPIISTEIFVNLLGVISIIFSARILRKTNLSKISQNLTITSFAIGFFLRSYAIEINEFATKTSFFLALAFPYIAFSFARKNPLNFLELFSRGALAGLICCLKPHYIFLPLLIEAERFFRNRTIRFFIETDKLVIGFIGISYLLLMLKLTPEFFEFMVPMWPIVYYSYSDSFHFLKNAIHLFGTQIIIYSGFFLIFLRQKFMPEDKIMALVFVAASLILISENLGSFDHLSTFFGLTIFIFIRLIHGFYEARKVVFFRKSLDKIIIVIIGIIVCFEPRLLLSLIQISLIWWIIFPCLIESFYYDLKSEIIPIKQKRTAFIICCGSSILILLASVIIAAKNQIYYVAFINTAFFAFLFFYEKSRTKLAKSFSPVLIFVQLILALNLLLTFCLSIDNSYRGNHVFKSPNFLSDNIISYSKSNLRYKSDEIVILSNSIAKSFPALTYLDKINPIVNNTGGALYTTIGNDFFNHQSSDKKNAIFISNYFFNDLKKQISDKNMKIIFVDRGDICLISFIENYLHDPEFRDIFLKNYHFVGRIFSSKIINGKPSIDDFEIYTRKND